MNATDPDDPDSCGKTQMPRELRRSIKAQFDRTGLNPRLFLKQCRNVPEGLDARTINAWIRGTTRDAEAAYVAFVIETLSGLPDVSRLERRPKTGPNPFASKQDRIVITPEMIAQMRSEMERTGAQPSTLLQFENSFPDGLTVGIIPRWLSGRIATVREDHWSFVMASFRAIPDIADASTRKAAARNKPLYRLITEEEHQALRDHRYRTALRGPDILKFAEAKPDDLTGHMIDGWISGATKSAKPGHVAYVIDLYASIAHRQRRPWRGN